MPTTDNTFGLNRSARRLITVVLLTRSVSRTRLRAKGRRKSRVTHWEEIAVKNYRSAWGRTFRVLGGLGLLVLCAGLGAQELTAPKYKFDPDWPKTLPNKWKMGGVTGLAVDKDDYVWV